VQYVNWALDHWTAIVAVVTTVYGYFSTRYAWAQSGAIKNVAQVIETSKAEDVKAAIAAVEHLWTPGEQAALSNAVASVSTDKPTPTNLQVILQQVTTAIQAWKARK
jgi:hypothetical protein